MKCVRRILYIRITQLVCSTLYNNRNSNNNNITHNKLIIMRNWLVNLVGFVIVVVVAALSIEPGTVVIAKPQMANGSPEVSRPSGRFQRTENFAAPPVDLDRPLVLLREFTPIVEEGAEPNNPPRPIPF
uniref:Uncharacterized protein n=1 Tax=Glossina brevipalpis TaxID=37001 RepID=A0A1A9WN89_9MUSC